KAMAEDVDGNIGMGIESIGAAKLSNRGFSTFAFDSSRMSPTSLFELPDGQVVVTAGIDGRWSAMRFDGQSFVPIEGANLPGHTTWGWNQMALQDSAGAWWFGMSEGVLRYPAVARLEQLASSRP